MMVDEKQRKKDVEELLYTLDLYFRYERDKHWDRNPKITKEIETFKKKFGWKLCRDESNWRPYWGKIENGEETQGRGDIPDLLMYEIRLMNEKVQNPMMVIENETNNR